MSDPALNRQIAEYVAVRLVALRKARGLRQSDLAPILGVQGGQISKYEKADSLITLDNLYKAAEFFEVPLSDLLPPAVFGQTEAAAETRPAGMAEAQPTFQGAEASPTAQSAELSNAFLSIRNPALREALLQHAKALTKVEI